MSTQSPSHVFSNLTTPRRRQVFEGARKTFFEGTEAGTYICHFTDNIRTGYPTVSGKGVINNRISELLFSRLTELSIPHHFVKRLNMREQLIRAVEPLPIKMTVYNVVEKSLNVRFAIEKGTQLPRTLFEFSSKGSKQHIISRDHMIAFGWVNEVEFDDMMTLATRVNDFLYGFFVAMGLRLVRFNLEFGRIYSGEFMDQMELLLIDELSPDTFEVQDVATGDFLNVDIDESDLASVAATYQHIAERLKVLHAVNSQNPREL